MKFHPNLLEKLDKEKYSLEKIHKGIRECGCNGCVLGSQENLHGPVLFRCSIPNPIWGIIGEAPGRKEDEQGLPFVGPAGELLNKMLSWMNLPLELQPILFNTVACRPISKIQGKENDNPPEEAVIACRPYLLTIIERIKPKLLVLSGKIAVDSFLPQYKKETIGKLAGKLYHSESFPGILFSVIYHPAFLLRKQGEEEKKYKKQTMEHLTLIKSVIGELNNE